MNDFEKLWQLELKEKFPESMKELIREIYYAGKLQGMKQTFNYGGVYV